MADSKPLTPISSMFPVLDTENRQCEHHGPYAASLMRIPGDRKLWTTCPECERQRVQNECNEIQAEMAAERRKARIEAMLGHAAIPKRFLNRTLENYETTMDGQQKAHRAAVRYAESWRENSQNGTSLIMCGNPGTGKTHLAVGIAKRVMDEGGTALFTRVIDMIRTVRETYSRDSTRTERQVIAEYARPDLLILDEVGHQHGSDAERLTLFDVINARYEQCRPTLLITNLSLTGLREYLDDRAQDRLREGGGRVIVFDWPSQRDKY